MPLHPDHKKRTLKRWAIVAAVYVVWNLLMYYCKRYVVIRDLPVKYYDYIYWTCERIFVVASFWALWKYTEKKYKWVIGALFWVAVIKLAYLILVITEVIKANDFQSLMAVLFTLVLSAIVLKWGK